jgi:hypothetical protein
MFLFIILASIGNKTETSAYLFIGLILAIPCIVGFIYYLLLQTYVITYDIVLNLIAIIFLVIEVFVTLYAIFNIKSNEKSF